MTQEVQITLKLEVDADKSKNDIHNFIMGLIRTHTFHSTTYERMVFSISDKFEIKEEMEIYE